MTSISELFPKCRKLAYDARQQLAVIQRSTTKTSSSELYLVLEELNRQLDLMEQLLLRETPSNRQVWKHKIADIRQEAADLQQQAQATDYASQYQRNRDEILRHRRRPGAENDTQQLAKESQSLQQSGAEVLHLISQGEATLDYLKDQRKQLRGVRGTIVNIGSALGLTQATMRVIERRDITDAYLVAAGMVVTLIVLYVVWLI